MHGSTGGGWKRNAPASPRQLPTQPSSVGSPRCVCQGRGHEVGEYVREVGRDADADLFGDVVRYATCYLDAVGDGRASAGLGVEAETCTEVPDATPNIDS